MPSEPLSLPPISKTSPFQRSHSLNVTLVPVTSATLPAYRRIITILLPIPYPPKFYQDSIANPTPSSLALCATWHDSPHNHNVTDTNVVGGIQCRLESIPGLPSTTTPLVENQLLYIQTLAVLSPFRSLGIATALVDRIISTVIRYHSNVATNITDMYAHVWEANDDALEWYTRRGFTIEEGIVEGYYRRLKPSGARIVRKRLGVSDWLRVKMKDSGDGTVDDAPALAIDSGSTATTTIG